MKMLKVTVRVMIRVLEDNTSLRQLKEQTTEDLYKAFHIYVQEENLAYNTAGPSNHVRPGSIECMSQDFFHHPTIQ